MTTNLLTWADRWRSIGVTEQTEEEIQMAMIEMWVDLDTDAIRARRSLREWVDALNVNYDAFIGDNLDRVTWPQVYHVIAQGYVSGGDFSDLINGSGWTVDGVADGSDPDVGTDVDAP